MRGLPAWCLLGSVVASVAGVVLGGGCLDICSFLGEPSCEYCPGDDAHFCGGC